MHDTAIDTRDLETVDSRLDLVAAEDDGDLLLFARREIGTLPAGDHFEFHYADGGSFVVRATERDYNAFTYNGKLLSFEFEGGEIRVTVDGKAAHVGQLPDYAMTISTSEASQPLGYEVRIDGTLRKQVYDDQEGEVDQDLSGYEMTGRVSGESYDKFTYDGEYQSIESDYPDYIVAYNNFQKVR